MQRDEAGQGYPSDEDPAPFPKNQRPIQGGTFLPGTPGMGRQASIHVGASGLPCSNQGTWGTRSGVAFESPLEDDFKGGFDFGVLLGGDGAVNLFALECKKFFFERIQQRSVFAHG